MPLGTILNQLARNFDLTVVYRNKINTTRKLDIPSMKNVSLRHALQKILLPIGLNFAFEDNALVIFRANESS